MHNRAISIYFSRKILVREGRETYLAVCKNSFFNPLTLPS